MGTRRFTALSGTRRALPSAMTPRSRWALPLLLVACASGPPLPPARSGDSVVYTADGRPLGVERASPQEPATYVHVGFVADREHPVVLELAPGWSLDEQGLHYHPETR